MIAIRPTDTLFQTSPYEGDPDCICSRCTNVIDEDECALRAFVNEGHGGEYRFCEWCQSQMGIMAFPDPPEDA